MADNQQAGSIYGEIDIRTAKLLKGLDDALKGVKDFASKAEGSLNDFSKSFEKKGALTSFLGNMKGVATEVVGVFGKIGSAIKSTIFSPINSVISTITNLKTILLGLATYKIFTRAIEVEEVTNNFKALTRAVDIAADSFLNKLRKAVDGTVNDMQLMATANQAIQFGIVKTADQFSDLITASKQLGDAMGVGTKEAVDGVVRALGTMSERSLKNLGIVFDSEAAYSKLAYSIGKTKDQLYEGERKTAFYSATMEKMRDLLGNVQGTQTSTMDGFKRFAASIANLGDQIAVIVSGPFAKLADSIAGIVTKAAPSLQKFLGLVASQVDLVFRQITKAIDDFVNGKLTLSGMMGKIGDGIERIVRATVDLVCDLLILGFDEGLPRVWEALKGLLAKGALTILQSPGISMGPGYAAGAEIVRSMIKGAEDEARDTSAATPLEKILARWRTSVAGEGKTAGNQGNTAALAWSGYFGKISESIQSGAAQVAGVATTAKSALDTTVGPLLNFFGGTVGGASAKANADREFNDAAWRMVDEWSAKVRELQLATGSAVDMTETQKSMAEMERQLNSLKDSAAAAGVTLKEDVAGALAERFGSARQAMDLKTIQDAWRQVEDQSRQAAAQLAAVGGTELDAQFESLDGVLERVFREISSGNEILPETWENYQKLTKTVGELRDTLQAVDLARFNKEVQAQIRDIDASVRQAGMSQLDAKVDQINEERKKKLLEVGADEHKQAETNRVYFNKRAAEQSNAITAFGREAAQQIRATDIEIQKIGKSPFQQSIMDLGEWRRQQIDVAGMPESEVEPVYQQKLAQARAKANREELYSFSRDMSTAVGQGLTDGIMKGEKPMKILADVGSRMFSSAFQKEVEKAIDFMSNLLTDVLSGLGDSLGLGSGLGSLATGMIAIGGAIWQNIGSKKSQTLDDVASQINSSEAIRGVVAGPTNVAISKVGEGMKSALRTTEAILADIRDVLMGRAGGGASGIGARNTTLPLTPSTAS